MIRLQHIHRRHLALHEGNAAPLHSALVSFTMFGESPRVIYLRSADQAVRFADFAKQVAKQHAILVQPPFGTPKRHTDFEYQRVWNRSERITEPGAVDYAYLLWKHRPAPTQDTIELKGEACEIAGLPPLLTRDEFAELWMRTFFIQAEVEA